MGSSSPAPSIEAGYMQDLKDNNDREVFKKTEDGVDFRTVSWIRASVIFLKGLPLFSYLRLPEPYPIVCLSPHICNSPSPFTPLH